MKEQLNRTPFDERNILTYVMPSFEDFLKLRSGFEKKVNDTKRNRAPIIFYKLFMVCVGSKRDNTKKLPIKKISEIFTPSQEGYVLLELKNNWERWVHLAVKKYSQDDQSNNKDDDKEDSASTRLPALYTNKKYHNFLDGWSEEGISQYNEYCSMVKADRNLQIGQIFEEYFLE